MDFKDYYKILGVPRDANADAIKKAYRKLVRKHHPDLSQDPGATQRMAELNEANEVLSDPQKRLVYDSLGAEPSAQDGRGFHPPPNWDSGFEFSGAGRADHSDFFEQLFGRAARAQRGRGGVHDAGGAQRGEDHHARIELDLVDAYTGAERTISLRSARLDEAGRVVSEDRQLQVKIPKGVFAGQHIRLSGRGGTGFGGAPAGDLLLEVAFKPDPRWRAEGRDVYQRLPVAPWEAMLGATVTVHTPGGDAEVHVPAGWRGGRKLRLKERGIPGAAGAAAGHLYLELELALPAADSDPARAAYTALAKAFAQFEPRSGVPA